MWILIRVALACGLGCIIARECGFDLPVPGNGDPFIETAVFVLIAVLAGEFIQIVRETLRRP